ncbi:MaoC/PaaZ C-terminal domain-containing protein [Corynebacterium gerontici]|uniref:MaoC like domain protein n=1 Tax=Corynebacterium gerontici TaxID=2079234 RepID=A0A3G6J3N4_9CORY|nr:MaoC/PaaZ C-terminal domain-containing protein [Corynebacterium gerontici]AZA10714.1 MaoC like domain protein [Corynebacterium gerontici]
MQIQTLESVPELSALYRRAAVEALGAKRSADDDPQVGFRVEGLSIDVDHLASYCEATGFRLGNEAPMLYPYVLAFPLAILCMNHPTFPFAPMGVVHLANEIQQHRPLRVGEEFSAEVRAENLRPHRRGLLVDMITRVFVGEELVWEQNSTFLKVGAKFSSKAPTAVRTRGQDGARRLEAQVDRARTPEALLRFTPADVARYAEASGDKNPIHTSKLGAKLFGFPRTIAHGMFTLAAVLAGQEGRMGEAVRVRAEFHKPVLLPARVEVIRNGDVLTVIKAGDHQKVHLVVEVS